ncbi:MAG TPA: metal-sulfur cluster assembly factor [Candidatus Baltobacteraceae bacterium]|nr:metal-sulfur cluster assembly factor [Candidatus Baltobacteraceae bacterium]
MPTSEEVRTALKDVNDPELHMSIIDLGLIYGVEVEGEKNEHVTVTMTLTSPMCPVGPQFRKDVMDKVQSMDGVETAKVDITFSPPWDPKEMASDDVKMMLGIW